MNVQEEKKEESVRSIVEDRERCVRELGYSASLRPLVNITMNRKS